MNDRIEPTVDPTAEPAPAPAGKAPPRSALDQLSRIEEKAARIEEKFARYEAVFGRVENRLDAAVHRVEEAARSVDAVELATAVSALKARVEQTPRFGAMIITALVTAIATTILLVAILRFAPGLLK